MPDLRLRVKTCILGSHPIGWGRYYMDWAGNCVCETHRSQVQFCVSCGRFCDTHAINVGGGDMLCSVCQRNIITEEQCASMARWIKECYRRTPIGHVEMCRLRSMTPEQLRQRSGRPGVLGLAQGVGRDYTVFFYRHISVVAFADILAHELLHIWQYDHNISPDAVHCEGVCNLGSYFILNAIGNAEAKARIERQLQSPDPVYGEGLRIMKRYYDHGGWQEAIRELRVKS